MRIGHVVATRYISKRVTGFSRPTIGLCVHRGDWRRHHTQKEAVFVNVEGAQESIPPGLESIPVLIKRFTNTGSGIYPLEQGILFCYGCLMSTSYTVRLAATMCTLRVSGSANGY